jgi:hypothetical protein
VVATEPNIVIASASEAIHQAALAVSGLLRRFAPRNDGRDDASERKNEVTFVIASASEAIHLAASAVSRLLRRFAPRNDGRDEKLGIVRGRQRHRRGSSPIMIVIASAAKQSIGRRWQSLDCFVVSLLAMTEGMSEAGDRHRQATS